MGISPKETFDFKKGLIQEVDLLWLQRLGNMF